MNQQPFPVPLLWNTSPARDWLGTALPCIGQFFQLLNESSQIRTQRRADMDAAMALRVLKGYCVSVQKQSLEPQTPHSAVKRCGTVLSISRQRMSSVRSVNPDLVRSSGFQVGLHQTRATVRLQETEVG